MNDYAWNTHVPLIKLILKVFDPQFVLELGIGHYSTPLFLAHESEKMFIENSQEWINTMRIKDEIVLLHSIGIPNQDIPVHDISDIERQRIIEYYLKLKETVKKNSQPRLLFVDNYSCCRALAINTLYPEFDLIIYHDCEPQSIARNNYYFEEKLLSNYTHYNLVTSRTWAGCFISNQFNVTYDFLKIAIEPIIDEYCKENNVTDVYLKL